MNISQSYLNKFKIVKRTEEQCLADELYNYFGKQYDWNMLYFGKVRRAGVQSTRELFLQIQKSGKSLDEQARLFMGILKKETEIMFKCKK